MTEAKQFDWLSVATIPLIILIALLTIRYNVGALLFHTTVEFFSVFVGVLMFVVVLNTEHFLKSDFLTFLGIGYFFLSIIDVMHTFTMVGLPYFDIKNGEVTIHFWLFGRLFEAVTLIFSTYFLKNVVNKIFIFIFFSISTLIISWVSFNMSTPSMFVDGHLSDFKIYTEYFIIFLLLVAFSIFIKKKKHISSRVLGYILSSIILTIGAELCFTLYSDFSGLTYVIGHLFKFLSYWSIYQAIVQTTLKEPLKLLTQSSNSYDAIPTPSIRVDKDANIVQVNEASLNHFELDVSDVLYQPIHRFFHPDLASESECNLCQHIFLGESLVNKEVFFPKTQKWFLLSIAPIDKSSSVAGMVQSLTDITRQKAQEIELEKHQQTLEQKVQERTAELEESLTELKQTQSKLIESEKMASLGHLVAGLSHEVNTPIGICVTATSSLNDRTQKIKNSFENNEITKAMFGSFIDVVEKSSDILITNLSRTTELMGSLKDISVDQSNEYYRTILIKSYVKEILCSLSVRLKKSRVKVKFDESDDFEVNCYPNAVFQILTNLVTNSIIHGFDSVTEGIIEIGIQKNNREVKIIYSDSGKGIEPEYINQIFEPFFTTKRGEGGSGLGMHIVYNLVHQSLKGSITCKSNIGQGIFFEITFPLSC